MCIYIKLLFVLICTPTPNNTIRTGFSIKHSKYYIHLWVKILFNSNISTYFDYLPLCQISLKITHINQITLTFSTVTNPPIFYYRGKSPSDKSPLRLICHWGICPFPNILHNLKNKSKVLKVKLKIWMKT